MTTTVKYILDLEDQASAPLKKVAAQAASTEKALDGASTSGKRYATAGAQVAQTSNKMANAGRAVAIQIPDVISQMSAGVPTMQVFTQQGLQVAQQLDLIGIASKAAQLASSPLGLVIAGLGTAAVVAANQIHEAREGLARYTDALKDADAATRTLTASQNALRLAQGDVAGFVGDLQIQTALLTGEISKSDVAAGEMGGKLADVLRPRLLAAGKAVAEVEVQITNLSNAIAGGALNVGERVAAESQLAALRKSRDELRGNLEAVKALESNGVDAIQAYAEAMESNMDAAGAAADGASSKIDAFRHTAEEAAKAAGALRFNLGVSGEQGGFRAEDFGMTSQDVDGLFSNAMQSALSANRVKDSASQMFGASLSRAMDSAGRMATSVAGGVSTAAGAALNPLGALGATGPQGAAIAEALAALQEIGEQGTDAIVERLEMQAEAIIKGFASLPELFNKLMQDLPYAIGQAVRDAITGNLLENEGLGFGGFVEKLINRLSGGLYGFAKGALGGKPVGEGFAVGDQRFVNRTGLAFLHIGETVVRSSGVASPSTARGMGGQPAQGGRPIIIQTAAVTPDVMRAYADQVGEQFDPGGWGRGTRTVFGG